MMPIVARAYLSINPDYAQPPYERNSLVTSVNNIAARLPSAKASRKITEVHDLFLFMAIHKVILE
jgi:hypothetical protein